MIVAVLALVGAVGAITARARGLGVRAVRA